MNCILCCARWGEGGGRERRTREYKDDETKKKRNIKTPFCFQFSTFDLCKEKKNIMKTAASWEGGGGGGSKVLKMCGSVCVCVLWETYVHWTKVIYVHYHANDTTTVPRIGTDLTPLSNTLLEKLQMVSQLIKELPTFYKRALLTHHWKWLSTRWIQSTSAKCISLTSISIRLSHLRFRVQVVSFPSINMCSEFVVTYAIYKPTSQLLPNSKAFHTIR
jgi:hypothetical protein